jgi:acyl-CoA dehydrogenase
MVDFSIPDDVEALRARVETFVATVVIPAEPGAYGEHGPDPVLVERLRDQARAGDLFAPQLPVDLGGAGLDHRGQAVVLEAAGYSLLGPPVLHCAAPDEGNMHLLSAVATPEQRERYLGPLAAGRVRSCFAMTEPPPGAGSDPGMLRTTATKVSGGWRIDGRKWLITGADGAAFAICMARTGDRIEHGAGATMFLVDADNPGWRVERVIEMSDRGFLGGHAELSFEECFVPDDAVLGEVGLGYRYAQVRLAPARLTHCMRWLGLARRALDIALSHAVDREAFGAPLASLGMAQKAIADSVIDLETSRALIWRAAWELDTGHSAGRISSIAKAHVAEALYRVIDRSVQLCGGLGVSHDTPLGSYLAEFRPFRIYDGPTETHLWSIARREIRLRESTTHAPD